MKAIIECRVLQMALVTTILLSRVGLPLLTAQEPLRLGPGRTSKKGGSESRPELKSEAKPKAEPNSEIGRQPTSDSQAPLQRVTAIELPRNYQGTTAEAWDALFAVRRGKPKDNVFQAGIRAQVRKLVAKEDFSQVHDLISAALRNDAAEPWMYEALALALEASGASEKDLERAILSTVDLTRDIESALTAAAYLSSLKLDRAAFRLFQDVASQDPMRPEPYLQALQCAQNLQDSEAIRWSCTGILRQAWPSDQKEVEQRARRVAEATIAELQRAGKLKAADAFRIDLQGSLARDIRVKVIWTGDADVDLSVLEPTGEVCSYRNPRTSGGGLILGDTFSRSSSSPPREGFSETFICPEGFTGRYQILLKRVWGEVAGGKVNIEIYTHYNAPEGETVIAKQLPLGKDGTLVVFELLAGRRAEPLPEARATTAAVRQIEVARHVLAQQIASGNESASGQSYLKSNAPLILNPLGQLAMPIARGAVGFRPQLSVLQDGPRLFAGPAVVSADRRFVRVRITPTFSTIGEVQTFNFATGSVGNGNGSGNTPTGGGGAGGGGGGIGGGGGTGT